MASTAENGKMAKVLLYIGGSIVACVTVSIFLFEHSEARCAQIEADVHNRAMTLREEINLRHAELRDDIRRNYDLLIELRKDVNKRD